LLSQAFPEGPPAHPSYPTGHGTVTGACIIVLKFFFDGSFVFPNPQMPTGDGLSLQAYTGSDAALPTLNGELAKLGHKVSFGHGIHAGIRWRNDTDTSLLMGGAVALTRAAPLRGHTQRGFQLPGQSGDGGVPGQASSWVAG